MNDLGIFLKAPKFPELVDALSRYLCQPGEEKRGGPFDDGREWVRHVWYFLGLMVVAIDDPDLVDDQGIPFSDFTSEVSVSINDRRFLEETMKLREMVARVLALHLRDELDPEAILV